MSQLAIWVEMEAKQGKEQEVANFLKSAQSLAEREQGTITWHAMRLGGPKFGIFDTFAAEIGPNLRRILGGLRAFCILGAFCFFRPLRKMP